MNENLKDNTALIAEYDAQIAGLIKRKNDLNAEISRAQKKNQDNYDCYDSTIKTKRELENILNNIVSYSRTKKQSVDSKVKLIRKMYERLEKSTNNSKIQRQFEELNASMNSVKRTVEKVEAEIEGLNAQIRDIDREIERISALKGAVVNGQGC